MKRERFLRLCEVMALTGLRRSTLYALNGFPAPIALSPRTVGWLRSEIEEWMAQRIKASRMGGAK